jgi:hypothetical protein
MEFSFDREADDDDTLPKKVVNTDIYYKVIYYNIEGEDIGNLDATTDALTEEQLNSLDQSYSMYDIIKANIENLKEEFKKTDDGIGFLSKTVWANVMEKVLDMHIKWLPMVPVLVLPQCLVVDDKTGDHLIDYEGFLNTFTANLNHEMSVAGSSVQGDSDSNSDTSSVTATFPAEESVNGFMVDALV